VVIAAINLIRLITTIQVASMIFYACENFFCEQIGEIYEKHLENEQKYYPTETLSRVIELDYLVIFADSNTPFWLSLKGELDVVTGRLIRMTIYVKYGDTRDCSALSEWISRIQRREVREGYKLCDSFECKEQAVTGKKYCSKRREFMRRMWIRKNEWT